MMKITAERELDTMPFDMAFNTGNGEELCHATGKEVCFEGDDPKQPASWWNEYQDSIGCHWYGR